MIPEKTDGSALNVTAPKSMAPEVTLTRWEGFEQKNFRVAERPCLLVVPQTVAPGRPWIWRTEFFGHEPQADIALLKHGYHVAYVDVQNMYGAPSSLDLMDKFHDFLVKEYNLSSKPVLEGFSRGGLFALNWGARNPGEVASLYLDAPVCDFKSWPGGKGAGSGSKSDWETLKKVYGLSEDEALAYQFNPIDNLRPLADAKIPILVVYGMADTDLPPFENIELLAKRYRELGGAIELIPKPGIGHHPHSLPDPAPIVEFVLKH